MVSTLLQCQHQHSAALQLYVQRFLWHRLRFRCYAVIDLVLHLCLSVSATEIRIGRHLWIPPLVSGLLIGPALVVDLMSILTIKCYMTLMTHHPALEGALVNS